MLVQASSHVLGSNSFAFLLYPLGNPLQRVHWEPTGVGLVLLNGPTLSLRAVSNKLLLIFLVPVWNRLSIETSKNTKKKNKTSRPLVGRNTVPFSNLKKTNFFNIEKTNETNLNSQKHFFINAI